LRRPRVLKLATDFGDAEASVLTTAAGDRLVPGGSFLTTVASKRRRPDRADGGGCGGGCGGCGEAGGSVFGVFFDGTGSLLMARAAGSGASLADLCTQTKGTIAVGSFSVERLLTLGEVSDAFRSSFFFSC